MDDYTQHKPDKATKINMTEATVRELCLLRNQEALQ